MKRFFLASIEKITFLELLRKSSTAFEKATLSNCYQVVFEKGLFKLGDLCIFFKENSKLPELKVFDSLKPNNFLVTRKIIEGEVSEGLCFPLSILPKDVKVELGKDVTKALNVTFHDICLKTQIEKTLTEKKLAKRKNIAERLINEIKIAFSDITLGNGISLREARAIDDHWVDRCQTSRTFDELENWQKVTDNDLKTYGDGLRSFSDKEGRTFYLPAYMCLGLREFIRTGEKPCLNFLFGILPPLDMDEHLHYWLSDDKILGLNEEQTLKVKHYIVLLLEDSSYLPKHEIQIFTNELNQYLVKAKKTPHRKSRFANKPQIKRHGNKKKIL